MRFRLLAVPAVLVCLSSATARTSETSKAVKPFVRVDAPTVVLTHVRVIDGTGAAAVDDQNVVIEGGRISAIQKGADVAAAAGTTVLDLRGDTVMPGIVGMHNHLFYIARPNLNSRREFEPAGAGAADDVLVAPPLSRRRRHHHAHHRQRGDLRRPQPEARYRCGQAARGPHLDVTGPYLEGAGSYFLQMPHLTGPEDARQLVDYWADRGVTSFKAYMNITRDELKAAIDAAHRRGLKVTGHLCSVTYEEAAELGIDDLEHGFFVNTQLDPGQEARCVQRQHGRRRPCSRWPRTAPRPGT